MKRLSLASALLCLLAACTASTPRSRPTPTIGPAGGRFTFCKDLAAASGIIYRPLETLTGPADAAPVEGWVVKIQEDAKLFDRVGSTAAATQARAFADAVSAFAEDLKRPVPSNQEAAKKWEQRAAVRRTQLLTAVSTQVNPFVAYCSRQLHTR